MISKNSIITIGLLALVVLVPACWNKKNTEIKLPASLYVLNVLNSEQYNECHIPGSINVPFDKVADFAQEIDKESEVVCYCSNYQCTASGYAAKQLKELGFEHVCAYEAGMAEWYQQGLPVEGAIAHGAPASDYLARVIEPDANATHDVSIISTQALQEKLICAGFLKGDDCCASPAPVA